jgi:phospholipase C
MINPSSLKAASLAVALSLLVLSCRGGSPPTPAIPPPTVGNDVYATAARSLHSRSVFGNGKIKHVVVIMQENRSFDDLFHGFPGADSASYGYGHGVKYTLQPWSLANPWDINHTHLQFLEDYDSGKGDGFDLEIRGFSTTCKYPRNHPSCWLFFGSDHYATAFSYVPQSEIKPYWTMAHEYALGDHAFASNNGPSYVSHQYMISGRSNHVAENPFFLPPTPPPPNPWGCDAPTSQQTYLLQYGTAKPPVFSKATGVEVVGPYPCFSYATAAGTLDNAGVSWSYYAPTIGGVDQGEIWSAFDAIWPVRFGEDWVRNVKSPETTIFNDIADKKLAAVSWIVPSWINSDHAGSRSLTGPDWVGSVVNAIGDSPYWQNTAVVVMWDEWGGWFDHVVPSQYADPHSHAYEGLGFRVPVIVISPYAKAGYVSHDQHEVASTLHLIEAVFGLPSLGGADARADQFGDMFDFSQPPLTFRKIPTHLHAADFLRQRASSTLPDY